jgi:hypothetical protein
MSTTVDIKDLGDQDTFELPNGSVFVVYRRNAGTGTLQARLWCAHQPDALTSEPPLVDFSPEQRVRRLAGNETREHYTHEGYVKGVFAREMERRHQVAMKPVNERMQREAGEQRLRDRARRPWWRKVLG